MQKKQFPYADILFMPYVRSCHKTPMSMEERAAQFAPFSALTGHKEALLETERQTTDKIVLAKDAKESLETKFQILEHYVGTDVKFEFEYFVPDPNKEGGIYQTFCDSVQKIDKIQKEIYVGTERIFMEQVLDIHSVFLDALDNEIC